LSLFIKGGWWQIETQFPTEWLGGKTEGVEMYKFLSVSAFLLLAAIELPAVAADKPVHTETTFRVDTSGGVTMACSLDFSILYQDYAYRQGALAMVSGSLTWIDSGRNLNLGFKLAGVDVPDGKKGETESKHFYVNLGSLAIDGQTIAAAALNRAEDKRDFLGAYVLPNSANFLFALNDHKTSISFNREDKGVDVQLAFDVDFPAVINTREYQDFARCIGTISRRAAAAGSN
jgi:hypothetical protein